MLHHRTPLAVFSSRPGPRLAAVATRPPSRRRRTRSSSSKARRRTQTPSAVSAAAASAADEADWPIASDDPDPAVVRLLEAHALEASAGCHGLASSLLAAAAADAARASPSPSLSSSADANTTEGATDLVAAARIQADIEAREAALVHSLLAATGRLHGARGALDVARGAAALSRAAGLRSAFRALQALKREPGLLAVPEAELARRALALKLALPRADVGALVSARPSLLSLGAAPVVSRVVGAAERQISALMPGIPWQAKLSEGGTVYWSFASVLDGSQGMARSLAMKGEVAKEGEEEEEEEEEEGAAARGGRSLLPASSSSPPLRRDGAEQAEERAVPPPP